MILTHNGGDLVQDGNDFALSTSLANQIPILLFGGNVEQDTKESNEDELQNADWWGNSVGFEDPMNSTFERTMRDVTLNSQGLSKLINAAKTDLSPLEKYADIEIDGKIPKRNQFLLSIILKEKNKVDIKSLYLFENSTVIWSDQYNHNDLNIPIGYTQNTNESFTENTGVAFGENNYK